MTTKIVVLGASTGFREVRGIIDNVNKSGGDLEIIGILDDNPLLAGDLVLGVPVLGGINMAMNMDGVHFVFAIGSMATQSERSRILEQSGLAREKFITLIDPSACVDSTAKIGTGCIVHNNASIGPGSEIGDFVVIAVNSAIGPDVVVESFSLITSFVLLLTKVHIGQGTYIGSMSCVIENVNVGKNSRIGVGSIVNRDVPEGAFAVGNPARILGNS
jgi:sugar O-acyltransferase (sialic acid O-acetyltransferase NeuD family)